MSRGPVQTLDEVRAWHESWADTPVTALDPLKLWEELGQILTPHPGFRIENVVPFAGRRDRR